jgi:IMP cyclohydrolase
MNALKDMEYSGRGVSVGMTTGGQRFMAYTLTGRSPSSQARELVQGKETGVIRTSVTDPEQLARGSPALLIYPAMVPVNDGLVVASNGAQTKLLYSVAKRGGLSPEAIVARAFQFPSWEYDQKDDRWIDLTTYEPDSNATPRISAVLHRTRDPVLDIVYKNDKGKQDSNLTLVHEFSPGQAFMITTYSGGNESPLLLPFGDQEPLEMSVAGETVDELAAEFYAAIAGGSKPGDNFRVSAAVMLMRNNGIDTAIINRSTRGD